MAQQGILEYVSDNLKRLREQHQLSQQQLADQSGVSRRTIAGLESGEMNISLTKLAAIASVLQVSFAELVSSPTAKNPHIHRVKTWQSANGNSFAELHCSAPAPAQQQVELWTWSLASGDVYQAEADPEGWSELLYIVQGSLTLTLDGVQHLLSAGSSFVYASSVPYSYANFGTEPLLFTRTVAY
ncbi:helix-turn-helix domain-containing protein [Acinetobacter sp. ANC 3791]|uniref:helix-turn-helix domain-containing protein n=1 Tax=Acinetobacter sp. ANC 3791 TaxID=2529836 RepID=UPI00103BF441|nr:XRE family transcriptional regulator [Acinetobacter sp. ANC 3791]TCB85187.1 XRE family transcriptional regulator [Acinetobacter sp. ANC 3791]